MIRRTCLNPTSSTFQTLNGLILNTISRRWVLSLDHHQQQAAFLSTQAESGLVDSTKDKKKRKVVLLAGPTGTGKSRLGLDLAETLNGEIISADSVQIYQNIWIASNIVSEEEKKRVPHHLIHKHPLDKQYNVSDWFQDCTDCVEDILSRGKVPIIVGGATYYLDWLLQGKIEGPPRSNLEEQSELEKKLKEKGWEESLQLLRDIDPERASVISENNYRRLARSLSVVTSTKKRLSEFKPDSETSFHTKYDLRPFWIHQLRLLLCRRLDSRCEDMIRRGLLKEAATLKYEHGLSDDTAGAHSIGISHALSFIDYSLKRQKVTVADFLKLLAEFQASTRLYARKQNMWIKNSTNADFFYHLQESSPELLLPRIRKTIEAPYSSFLSEAKQQKTMANLLIESGLPRDYITVLSQFDDNKMILAVLAELRQHLAQLFRRFPQQSSRASEKHM